MNTNKVTEKIKLWGIVQGVGFRPFVAKCADRYGMKGEVLNIGGLVDIIVTDTPARIDAFVCAIQREKPAPAEIVHIKREQIAFRPFERFTILQSDEGDDEAAMIPADLSICPDCLRELEDERNPRYRHPFISCMVCGPRYTVIDRIPYDRENTAMVDWPMCGFCESEYTDRNDRRYHAQTISCNECGPYLRLRMNEAARVQGTAAAVQPPEAKEPERSSGAGETERSSGATETERSFGTGESEQTSGARELRMEVNDTVLRIVCDLLAGGKVVAMKGVGGYNLLADPFSCEAVKALRRIKGREQKPFAVMFAEADEVRKFCRLSEAEESLIKSSAKPIILLEHRGAEEIGAALGSARARTATSCGASGARGFDFSEIEKSRFIGSFLPSMGAQYMLLKMYGSPLIVTSANLSDMPIIKDEEEMFEMMSGEPLIAACLYNERDIRVRVDDSVVRVIDGQPQMIRRSKGYAPVPLFLSAGVDNGETAADGIGKSLSIFAAGGQLKNSFSLSKGQFAYVSQYFGDLDSAENRRIYEENVARMAELFRIEPRAVACDLHPLYFTTAFAERYAAAHGGLPVFRVQHHHAHIASVMAEHNLGGSVIGVSMDGTGYGTDGTVWGGEFLVCRGGDFIRAAHLPAIQMIGGDGSMKEAWKSAMCYLYDAEHGVSTAAAADATAQGATIALGLSDIFDYAERHGGIKSRGEWTIVRAALENNINTIRSSSMGRLFDAVSALLGIKDYNDYEGQCAILLEDAAARALAHPGASERDDLALAFHERTARMIAQTCGRIRSGEIAGGKGVDQVALSGGVFQNKILMERTLALLRTDGFSVFYNVSVSPNDGGIALGQNYVALQKLLRADAEPKGS